MEMSCCRHGAFLHPSTVHFALSIQKQVRQFLPSDLLFFWCPRADSKAPPAGKSVTRVSTARIRPLDQKSPAPWWYRARYCSGAPGRIRTVDTRFRRAVLYPLSYGGMLY